MKFVYVVVSNWIVGAIDYDLSAEVLEVFSNEQDAINFANEYKKECVGKPYFYNTEVIKKELK